jgi:hypothetical protein
MFRQSISVVPRAVLRPAVNAGAAPPRPIGAAPALMCATAKPLGMLARPLATAAAGACS